MAIDGRKDTAWRPDAEATFNLWQWVRFDFGREVEITRMEIDNGVWQVPGEEESFCARARPDWYVHLDRDESGVSLETDVSSQWSRFVPGYHGSKRQSFKTRVLTLRIRSLVPSRTSNWDTGLTEVRFFGRSAGELPAEAGPVTCGSRRLFELRDAVLDHCGRSKSRPNAECQEWVHYFQWCRNPETRRDLKWLPISETQWSGPRLELHVEDSQSPLHPKFGATFARDELGRWRVEALTCRVRGAACRLYHQLLPESGADPDPEKLAPSSCKMLDGRRILLDGKVIVPVAP
jgi:hypothetical protein